MAYQGKKGRLSRREGMNLFLKGSRSYSEKEEWNKRQSRPGQHGARPSRLSSYARQLREKQRVKRMYGMREKQFKRFYEIALKTARNSSQDKGYIMLQLLERRLDNVVYSAQLARSKATARQIITHGHVKLNGKKVSIPSYIVKVGDVVEVKVGIWEKVKVDYKGPIVPAWLEPNRNMAKVLMLPTREQIDPSIRESLIVELYSR